MTAKSFQQKLAERKILVQRELEEILSSEEKYFSKQQLAPMIFQKLKEFSVSGKMLRAGLLLMALELLEENSKKNLQIAVSLELLHSGLLIDDDIIDQDQLRRGKKSLWFDFQSLAEEKQWRHPKNYGESLAICTANIAFALSEKLFQKAVSSLENAAELREFFFQEITRVNLAEMLDVQLSADKEFSSLEDILEMYRDKTAHYTFSLALGLAGRITKVPQSELEQIEKIGESIGLIFQIKDDQIGIFSQAEKSGKVQGSDIREAKRTVHAFYLLKNIEENSVEKEKFMKIFGNPHISTEDIEFAQLLFRLYAQADVKQMLQDLEKKAKQQIQALNNQKLQKLLENLLEFNLQRDH